MRFINPEISIFVITGSLTTLITYALYLAFLLFVPYAMAYSTSFAAGIAISYTLNTIFVFRQPWLWRKLFQFPLVYLVQYVVGLLLLAVFVDRFHVDEKVAPLINVVLLLPLTFLISKWIIKPGART